MFNDSFGKVLHSMSKCKSRTKLGLLRTVLSVCVLVLLPLPGLDLTLPLVAGLHLRLPDLSLLLVIGFIWMSSPWLLFGFSSIHLVTTLVQAISAWFPIHQPL